MTLYRLLLPDILLDVDECIYLDSDTLICDDIADLFSYDISNCYLAAVVDSDISKVPYNNMGNLDLEKYFNAGVLVLNLAKLRNDNKVEEFLSSIDMNWQLNDQDILNKSCLGKVIFLEGKYNRFSYSAESGDDSVVIHFLGDPGMRPWQYLHANMAEDWWKVASIFEDTSIYKETRRKAEERYKKSSFRYVIERCNEHDNIYIFGSGFYGKKLAGSLSRNGVQNIKAFLDNNDKVVGTKVIGHNVISPNDIDYDKDNFFIISVRNTEAQESIKAQLLSLGATENQILCYEENPPEVYHYMDPKYQEEEKENVFLRELGSGTARLGWEQ